MNGHEEKLRPPSAAWDRIFAKKTVEPEEALQGGNLRGKSKPTTFGGNCHSVLKINETLL